MNVWKLIAANKLIASEAEVPPPQAGKIKVRVSKVLLCAMDASLYAGSPALKNPIIPGRFAVGRVLEDNGNALFPKGARVLLHTFLPVPDSGTEKRDFMQDDYLVCGQTTDGFLRDIVYLSPDEMTPLPDSISNEKALLLHHIALAKASVDKLQVKKGQHIAVVGANILGIFICQLLIYQQAAPILIGSDPNRLNFAHGNGVYYVLPAEEVSERIVDMTGGRLAGGAIMVSDAESDASVPMSVCARESSVVVTGFSPSKAKLPLDIALRKQIDLHFLSNCADYLEAAINLVVNKAVNIDMFRAVPVQAANLGKALAEYAEHPDLGYEEYLYVNLF